MTKVLQKPLGYLGVYSNNPPNFRVFERDPLSSDYRNFKLGDLWLNKSNEYIYMLTNKNTGVATWSRVTNPADAIFDSVIINPGDLTLNNGSVVFDLIQYRSILKTLPDGTTYGLPDGDDGEVLIGATGLAAAWGSITSSGGTVTITKSPHGINLEAAGGTSSNTFTTDDGNAVSPTAGGNVDVDGGSNITTSGATANTITIDLDSDISLTSVTTTGNVSIGGNLSVTGNLVSYLNINSQTGTAYTLVLTDANKEIILTNTSAITLTVPPNSSVAFPIGTVIILHQGDSGTVTVSPGTGVTINSASGKLSLYEKYSGAALIKQDTDVWQLMGDIK